MKKIYLLLALILIANCKPSKSDNQTSESDKTVKTKAYSETDPSKTRAIAVHVLEEATFLLEKGYGMSYAQCKNIESEFKPKVIELFEQEAQTLPIEYMFITVVATQAIPCLTCDVHFPNGSHSMSNPTPATDFCKMGLKDAEVAKIRLANGS